MPDILEIAALKNKKPSPQKGRRLNASVVPPRFTDQEIS
jgi:hypothetical protein